MFYFLHYLVISSLNLYFVKAVIHIIIIIICLVQFTDVQLCKQLAKRLPCGRNNVTLLSGETFSRY